MPAAGESRFLGTDERMNAQSANIALLFIRVQELERRLKSLAEEFERRMKDLIEEVRYGNS